MNLFSLLRFQKSLLFLCPVWLATDAFAEEVPIVEQQIAEDLNSLPEKFADRMIFPIDQQAFIMAERGLQLPKTDADLSTGALAGLQPMPERQVFLDGDTAGANSRDTLRRRFDEPVTMLLSKYRYPWEDRHLDVIVWATPEDEEADPEGYLEVTLKDADGKELAVHEITNLSPTGSFFSVGFPEALKGGVGTLQITWRTGEGDLVGEAEETFHVNSPSGVSTSGQIPLDILNEPGATIKSAPMTVGVPFHRGALSDSANVRLVDAEGNEHPLQTRVSGKWSRFGPVKWLLCDFTVDLDGEPRKFYLEFGPDIERTLKPEIEVKMSEGGFPFLDAGTLRVSEEGLSFEEIPVLTPEALHGGFVKHENGKVFGVPRDVEHAVEEIGSEKIMIRRTGWYVDEESGERFCNFVTRVVFHRNSPVARVFHTWIFTGNSSQDRIADMGWRFDTPTAPSKGKFLSAFEGGQWLEGESLVQFDYEQYLLTPGTEKHEGRTPGVLTSLVDGVRINFGAKDFWQNFPSELEINESGFTFYNWPRRNPPASFERPVDIRSAFRHRYAHEGEVLDFSPPKEYASDPIWKEATNNSPGETHWAKGRPETVNAQGVARTEEMFLYFTEPATDADQAAKVMRGLNDETIRAVVDPQWVTASEVFGRIHPVDKERFPDEERIYELTTKAPAHWVDRLKFYGMWLHGDYPTWNMNLNNRTVSNYRTLRKTHHQYPLKWVPFARSGDPEHLKLAENAARQMTDANFCHFATEEVDALVGPDHYRRQGRWDRSLFPWAGRHGPVLRSYTSDSDYLWDTYYVTGYGRARDVGLLYGELLQHDHAHFRGGRHSQGQLVSYLDMYQATFDPWFLDAAHGLARMHQIRYGAETVDPLVQLSRVGGESREHWRGADRAFYEFTGSDAFRQTALNSNMSEASPAKGVGSGDGGGAPDAVFMYEQTGDPMYLARVAAMTDTLKFMGYEGGIDYMRGLSSGSHGYSATGVARSIPEAMAILAKHGEPVDPIHNPAILQAEWINRDDKEFYHFRLPAAVFMRKNDEVPLELRLNAHGQGAHGDKTRPFQYEINGPAGLQVSGEGNAPEALEIEGPAGIYRIELSGSAAFPEGMDQQRFHRRLSKWYFPITAPGVPEVVKFEPSDSGTKVQARGQGYWFLVPEGVEEFWIEFHGGHRLSVWNPDGDRVWDHSAIGNEPGPDVARITVPEGQDGKLWRATGGSFTIDPNIPPYFALSQSRWFNPEEGQ